MKRTTYFLAVAVAIIISSCNTGQNNADPTGELSSRWAEFEEAWNRLDAKACAAFYTEDAVNIPPGLSINNGREAIEEFYTWLFSLNSAAVYKHTIVKAKRNGNYVFEQGEFTVNWTNTQGEEWLFDARSVTYWEKAPDGKWMIKAFMFNRPQ